MPLYFSKNFSLAEFERSETAERLGISNVCPTIFYANLRLLCAEVLQPLRDLLGFPLRISSGYRSPILNKSVGGAASSQHQFGLAADIACTRADWELIGEYIEKYLDFDQLIYERSKNSYWIHVSYVFGSNRHQVIKK